MRQGRMQRWQAITKKHGDGSSSLITADLRSGKRKNKWMTSSIPVLISFFLLAAVIVSALVSGPLAPHDPLAQNLANAIAPPVFADGGNWDHPLGTDQLGRDILSRIIYGARISLIVGFITVFVSCVVGTAVGLTSGYFSGIIDDIVMRIADAQMAIPFILLSISVMAVLGASLKNLLLTLSVFGWVFYARLVRSQVLSEREREYVQAARALGASVPRIVFRHILPNVLTPVLVVSTFYVPQMIVAEASLSFLGLGVPPPTPTWGGMLAEGKDWMTTAWWLATIPGLAIMLMVLSINIIGDWLRDTLDPRHHQVVK